MRGTKRRKNRRSKTLLFMTILVILFLVLPMAVTIYLYNSTFGQRVDSQWDLYSYLNMRYPDFKKDPMEFHSNRGQLLKGYLYHYNKLPYKGLIVISCGIGRGQDSYLLEGEYFA